MIALKRLCRALTFGDRDLNSTTDLVVPEEVVVFCFGVGLSRRCEKRDVVAEEDDVEIF